MTNPIISKFFNINRPSIALIILAWIAFNFKSIFLGEHLKMNELLLFFLSILFLDIIFIIISNKKISLFIFLNTVLFIFGSLLTLNIQNLINNLFDIFLRGRMIFLPLFFFVNIALILINKSPKYSYINIFLFIFITINFSKNLIRTINEPKKVSFFENKKIIFPAKNKNKAILFLILDEYHSPDDLYRVTKDSSLYNFSLNLEKNDWQINNSFHSEELYTVCSLSSMFNYNLSSDSNFINLGQYIDENLFSGNLLYADLVTKKVNIVNWGIFKFGSKKPTFSKSISNPTSTFGKIFKNTTLGLVINNNNELNLPEFKNNYFPYTKHNIEILNKLSTSLIKIPPNTFIYSHLYMPHSPFYYPKFFSFKKTNLKNYISYWKFTNSLIENKLLKIGYSNNIKVIITGDHGFRKDTRLNKNKTFLALYGFNNLNINEIKTVQDLGSLINSNFQE